MMRYRARVVARIMVPAGVAICVVAGLPAAAATTAAVPRPSITSFTVSRSTLPSSGGSVTLKVTATHATWCTFSSTPSVHGLPARVSCSGGAASKKVSLPANTAATAKSYNFQVTPKAPGGTRTSTPLTVTVHGAKPAVTGFAAAPNGLTSAGGTTTLAASVVRSTSCVLSAVPAVAGLPATFACPAGTTPKPVSRSVSLPALIGTTAVPYAFTLTVTGAGGTTKATTTQTVWPAMTIAAPAGIDVPAGGLDDISCASSSFCIAVDSFGNALTYDGTSWSGPAGIDSLPGGLVTGMTTAVSCPTTSFCAELAQDGDATFFDGHQWSKPVNSGLGAAAVSCASSSFCAAVGGSYASSYAGTSWAAPFALVTNTKLVSVSCPTTSFCLAVNLGGDSFTFNGSTWSTKTAFDEANGQVTGVACLSATACVAVDGDGYAAEYNGSTWTAPAKVTVSLTPSGLDAVSCVTGGSSCLASSSNGSTYTFKDSSWSAPFNLGGSAVGAVSCPSGSFCAILATGESVWTGSGMNWSQSASLESTHGFTTAVSCPTTKFCAATDWTNDVVFDKGGSWGPPHPVDQGGLPFASISCASASFCVALEEPGIGGTRSMRYNGTSWVFFEFLGQDISSVSCTSPTFCMAMETTNDDSVDALTWNGSTWSQPVLVDSSQGVSPPPGTGYVSCASPAFCAMIDSGGNAWTYDGTSWSGPDTIDAGVLQPLDAISCPSAAFCTAIDGFGQVFTFNGTSWSSASGIG